MAETTHREMIERLMHSHPHFAEAIAYLASIDAGIGTMDAAAPRERWDHDLIASLVEPGSSVLDLGCGDGSLLHKLISEKGCRGQGIEKETELVLQSIQRGVPVLQLDADEGLGGFPNAVFDYVVLEETLQTVQRPEVVLEEMLRVGKLGIVSFPNFGHWWVRTQLLIEGRMPMTPRFPFTWYGTPNIHVLTIRDFETWCGANQVTIKARYAFAEGEYHELMPADNVLAEEALFVIGRDEA
ncbi:MAG: methionine biosynthesis protein MetW [Armatimonadetes bacterium]|nr:methionine biosynthesis protein MetW [Armatimonadota bacterium]